MQFLFRTLNISFLDHTIYTFSPKVNKQNMVLDCWENDPTAGKITEDLNIPTEQLKDIADSFASVKVSGVKPMI